MWNLLRDFVEGDRKSTRLNSSHSQISYAVFCLKKKIYTTRSDSLGVTRPEHIRLPLTTFAPFSHCPPPRRHRCISFASNASRQCHRTHASLATDVEILRNQRIYMRWC